MVIAGKTVSPEDLERIQINETRQDSAYLNAAIRQEHEARGSYMSVDYHGRLSADILADNGRDVTARFIIGPPGHEAETAAQPSL